MLTVLAVHICQMILFDETIYDSSVVYAVLKRKSDCSVIARQNQGL